jgi:hypothetical protein
MAASVSAAVGVTTASATSLAVSTPGTPVPGDTIWCALRYGTGTSLVIPTGWFATNQSNLYFYPVISTVPSTHTFSWSTGNKACAVAWLMKGITGVTEVEVIPASTTASSTSAAAPSVTLTRNATEILVSAYLSDSATAITVPGSQTPLGSINANATAAIIGWDSPNLAVSATGTVSASGTPADGNTVVVGGRTYTFKTTMTPAEGEVHINGQDGSMTNLASAINKSGGTLGTDYQTATANAFCTSGAVAAHIITLTYRATGTAGNATTLTKVGANLAVSGATFSGGVDAIGATGTRTATVGNATWVAFSVAYSSPPTGAIGTTFPNPAVTVANWWTSVVTITANLQGSSTAVWFNSLLGSGSLSGEVTAAGIGLGGVLVCLYERRTGLMISYTRTAADGSYAFYNLSTSVTTDNSFCVSATDPNGLSTVYNSMEWDRLIPV